MRKIVVIIVVACMVVAVFATALFTNVNQPPAGSASGAQTQTAGAGSIIVWNTERDQKVFETADASVVNAVRALLAQANWSDSAAAPSADLVRRQLILSIYDETGKAEQYTLLYLSDNSITLINQQANTDGQNDKANFPDVSGGLNDYLKITAG